MYFFVYFPHCYFTPVLYILQEKEFQKVLKIFRLLPDDLPVSAVPAGKNTEKKGKRYFFLK